MTGPTLRTIKVESCCGCDCHRAEQIAPGLYVHRCLHEASRETYMGTPNGVFIAACELVVRVPHWCPARA